MSFQGERKKGLCMQIEEKSLQLKVGSRQWCKRFELVMGQQGYKKITCSHYVFVWKFSDDDFVILLLYINDMMISGKNAHSVDNLKKLLI